MYHHHWVGVGVGGGGGRGFDLRTYTGTAQDLLPLVAQDRRAESLLQKDPYGQTCRICSDILFISFLLLCILHLSEKRENLWNKGRSTSLILVTVCIC